MPHLHVLLLTGFASWFASTAGVAAAQETSAAHHRRHDGGDAACDGHQVEVVFSGNWTARDRRAVLDHLAASLGSADSRPAARDFSSQAVCLTEGEHADPGVARKPRVAAQLILIRKPGSPEITIEIRDFLTDKRVARDVQLAGTDAEADNFLVAAAGDELLRATWAELALRSAQQPETTPEAAVPDEEPVDASQPIPSQIAWVALDGGAELHAAGVAWFGPQMAVGLQRGTLFAEVTLGFRASLDQRFGDATVATRGALVSLGAGGWLLDSPNLRLGPALGLTTSHVWFESSRGPADQATGWTVYLRGGAAVELGKGPWIARAGVGVAAPLVGLEGTQDGRTLTGVAGPALAGNLGLGWRLP